MRPGILLAVVAAIAVGVLAQRGPASPRPQPARQTAQLEPRGSVVTFNARGHRAPLAVALPPGPATPTRVARAFLDQSRPAAARHLVHTRTQRLDARHTIVRFAEQHDGVPVIGGDAVVVVDDHRRVVAASSEVLPDAPASTTPDLSVAQARSAALAAVARQSGRAGLVAAGGTLALFDPRLVSARGIGRPALVWDVTVRRTAPTPVARRVLVDAHMGAVALELEADQAALNRTVCDAASTSGQVPCTAPVRTEGGAPSAVTDVNLAHQYAGDTYAFYKALGRDSLDGNGMTLKSTVRYCPSASSCPYQNAYWNGAQMVYGAGFAAADDVVGHELTHGVTEFSSHLFYYAQSGAINESLSDIFGEFIDLGNGAGTDTPAVRWKIGEDIPGIGAIRDMKDPTVFGDPDRTSSPNYSADAAETDSGGVHTNSSVSNKAAYLLTDGATFNGTTVAGIGTDKATKVYYAASQILRSGSDFRDLADALDQACGALTSSAQVTAGDCAQVTAASTATQLRTIPANAPVTTAPVCGAGETAVSSYHDDFASGPSAGWTRTVVSGTRANSWYWDSETNPLAFDARYSPGGDGNLWGDDPGAKSDTAIAMTSSVTVPATGAHLRIRHAFGFDDTTTRAYDGGVLEYSTNGGSTWTDAGSLMTEGGYNGSLASAAANPLGVRPAFVRESNGYGVTRLDLSSLAGQQVRFRLRIGSGSSTGDYGWFVDDVSLYRCQAPDATPPDTSFSSTPGALTSDSTPTFAFSSSEAGSTFECRVDLGSWVSCASPVTTAVLADGAHVFAVRAIDGAGNVDPTPASVSFTVDTQAPDTSFSSTPGALTSDSTPSFGFSSPDGSATFECRVDAGAWVSCASPATTVPLVDGGHSFAVRAKDAAGNVDASPASVSFTVDTQAPNTSFTTVPATLTSDSTPSFGFTATEAGTFECQTDLGPWVSCASPLTTGALPDGSHTFSVRATDAAGNVDASPASVSFTVDTQAPDTSFSSTPGALTSDGTPTFGFSSPDASAMFECRVDAGAWVSCVSPLTTVVLTDGSHTFAVRATDAAGNVDPTPASASFTVDTQAPNTSIDSAPAALTSDGTPSFGFSSPDASATFECRVDAGAWVSCVSPLTTAALADGAHAFAVRAIDAAGNVDATPASVSFTVDTQAPQTSFTPPPPTLTSDGTPSFGFSSAEAGSSFECRVDLGSWVSCASPVTTGTLTDGNHTFSVRATDPAGNVDATPASVSFTVDTQAPNTSITTAPPTLTSDSTPSFGFTATEAGTFECQLDLGAWASCASPLTTAVLVDGVHVFAVRAIDAAGNVDASPASVSFTVDTQAPSTSIDSSPAALTSDSTPSFGFSSPDASATFECRVDAGSWVPCASPLTTGALTDGNHAFSVRATDAAGNVDVTPASASFTVDTQAPDTSFTTAPPTLTADGTPSFGFSSPDASATFECRVDAGSWVSCASPLTTGALTDGSHTFSVRATDAAGNVDASPASASFTVDTQAPDTSIDSAPGALTSDGTPSFGFSSPDVSATFECRVDAGSWVSCVSSLTTGALTEGAHAFAVRATDAAGNVDATPASVSFTVDTQAPNTSFTSAPPALTSDGTPSFAFSSSETGSSFECRVDLGPWASCASPATSGALTDGDHAFAVRATDPAGNTDATPATATFTVDTTTPDTTAPDTQIDFAPPLVTPDTTPTLTFSASEPGATFECRIDDTAWAACSSPFTAPPLPDGTHTFAVRASDSAGNTDDTPATASFTIATAPGQPTAGGAPQEPPATPPPAILPPAAQPGATVTRSSPLSLTTGIPRIRRTTAGVRVSVPLRCSAPCRTWLRVRIPTTLARALGLRGVRIGDATLVSVSVPRRRFAASGTATVRLPGRLARRPLATILTLTAGAEDAAGRRVSAPIGRLRLPPRR